ncbi:LON peptidase substrate-binding domain-containing protein [Runella slithyformis]|uniref:Peptidase S16 lon domain protein n=1 Tax=Runella slithyformis (strain ATCC 29530 / DSM 19594 / LMG 11500 / NCIMB 11436 / LSU 4) TaxID=761193 RepID=A0A7U3ZHE8_RUNSL|nr:LON peptidase substrate-binding domain-containing protein [Runella slithyformis]AEI47284.1 peptidase S16 lon domain protein [Runella slithyformis DSM 19594]
MESFLPFFPLNLVAYPTENLHLHVFEPRYQQLINECLNEQRTFGIPAFINNKLPGYGTEMKVVTVSKRYDDGRMDIKTRGLRAFRVLTFKNPVPEKLYSGGKVTFVEETESPEGVISELLLQLDRLYTILQTRVDFDSNVYPFSYQVAHKVGLSQEEEYKVLTIDSESERQRFLLRHLNKVIPVMAEMEKTKERIKLNGHFKNLDPLNF